MLFLKLTTPELASQLCSFWQFLKMVIAPSMLGQNKMYEYIFKSVKHHVESIAHSFKARNENLMPFSGIFTKEATKPPNSSANRFLIFSARGGNDSAMFNHCYEFLNSVLTLLQLL